MRPLSRLGFSPQRVLDCSVAALAVGCGWIGYKQIENEDSATQTVRLQREELRRQRLRAEVAKRRFEQLKYMSRLYEEKIEGLAQKRQEVLLVLEKRQAISSHLQNVHKELEMEIDDLRKRVQAKEQLQASSPSEFESGSHDSGER